MAESSVEVSQKLVLKNPSKRQEYLDLIDRCLETAYTKFQSKYCKNHERIAWLGKLAQLVEVGNHVLHDEDLDSIEKRLEALENLDQKINSMR